MLIALGVDWDGRRSVLAVEVAGRESVSSETELQRKRKARGLQGVECVVSGDHAGLRKAIQEELTDTVWQRCHAHSLENTLDYLPGKADDDCLAELRWLYDRHGIEEARLDLAKWLEKWTGRYAKLCHWVEEHIEEKFAFYRLPKVHLKHLKSTNLLERLHKK